MIDDQAVFALREWDWLRIRLEVNSLLFRGKGHKVLFDFESSKHPEMLSGLVGNHHPKIICYIWGTGVQEMMRRKLPREQQQTTFQSWVDAEKERIFIVLADLPVASKNFDIDNDLAFVISHDEGMSGAPLVTFVGGEVLWTMPELTRSPKRGQRRR